MEDRPKQESRTATVSDEWIKIRPELFRLLGWDTPGDAPSIDEQGRLTFEHCEVPFTIDTTSATFQVTDQDKWRPLIQLIPEIRRVNHMVFHGIVSQILNPDADRPQVLIPIHAAEYLCVPPSVLPVWRSCGLGPSFIRAGEGCNEQFWYVIQDLDEWLEDHKGIPKKMDWGRRRDSSNPK